ncbi:MULTISPECIES: hypothetical protein [Luteimonas]|uniref:hypothetical protein n=1 Tax=Luteimonas TaxID=83614 RepID=UPI001E2AAE99|nr:MULTISPECIES: hypothetical protein [Luteimonas]
MTKRTFARRARFWFWAVLFVGYSAAVAGVVVDAVAENYRRLSSVTETTAASPVAQRELGAAQIAALHRAQSGAPFQTLAPGETFRVVWPDGSSEVVRIVSPSAEDGVQSMAGDAGAPLARPRGQAELQVLPVSTEAPRRDPSVMAEAVDR